MNQSNIRDLIWRLRGSVRRDGTVCVRSSNGRGSVMVGCGIGADKQSMKLKCDRCGFWENAVEFVMRGSSLSGGSVGCLCATCKMKTRKDSMGRSVPVGDRSDEGYVRRLRESQRHAIASVARTEGKRKKLKAERNLVMRESNNDRRYYELYAAKKDALAMEGKSMSRRLREAYFRRREAAFEARKKVAEIDRILAEINLEQRK